MGRIIKFRAWDKKNKVNIDIIGFVMDKNTIRLWWKYNIETDQVFNESFPIDQIILEQYAGLKDIFTDKECCENDLIDWYDRHKDKVIRFKVAFKDGTFVGIPIGNPNMSYQLSILLCRTMHSEAGKIIGNIHEATNAN